LKHVFREEKTAQEPIIPDCKRELTLKMQGDGGGCDDKLRAKLALATSIRLPRKLDAVVDGFHRLLNQRDYAVLVKMRQDLKVETVRLRA
jgi:hypothetical protein